jgi:hypothetical protein
VATLLKGDGSHGAKEVSPSRPSSIAREGAFTFPPEPARATPPPPKIARTHRHELGCKETRVSGVSPEPGEEAGFGSREPGQLAGQRHKHGDLQPRSAAEPVGRPRKRAPESPTRDPWFIHIPRRRFMHAELPTLIDPFF